MLNKFVMSMASLRVLSGSIEICAALLMLRLNQLDKALLINSSLALVGLDYPYYDDHDRTCRNVG